MTAPLPWQSREVYVTVQANEDFVETRVDRQRWSYSIRPVDTGYGLRPTDDPDGVEILIKVRGIETVEAARTLCELIAEAVSE